MKPRLLLASAVAGTLLLTAVPVSARPADPMKVVEATRYMTVSAAHSAYIDLQIPTDARLPLNYGTSKDVPTPRFSRGDEFAALVLASQETIGETYAAFRLPNDKGVVRREISLAMELCMLDRYCEIAAGDYRLFLVTDVPASVEIELKGLRGSSSLELDRRMVGQISGATASYLHTTPSGAAEVAAHGAGFSPTLTGGRNFLFSAFWFRGPHEPFGPVPADQPLLQVGVAGSCSFAGAPQAEMYAPGCPTGDRSFNFTSLYFLRTFGYQQFNSSAGIGPGEISRGYYAWHTGVRDPGFVGFWLDLTS